MRCDRLVPMLLLAGLAGTAACSPAAEEPVQEAVADSSADLGPPPPPQPAVDPALAAFIAAEFADMGDLLLASGEVDLDGEGAPEVLAYVGGPSMCGTGGCPLLVLRRAGEGFEKVGEISVAQLPVGVFASSTGGWRDLAVSVYGGGAQAGVAKVPFADERYFGNPTVPPAELSGEAFETVIADAPLEPLVVGD